MESPCQPPGLVRTYGRKKQVPRRSAFGATDFLGAGGKGGHSKLCHYKEIIEIIAIIATQDRFANAANHVLGYILRRPSGTRVDLEGKSRFLGEAPSE